MLERLPWRLGTMPAALNMAASAPTTEWMGSSRERSITWPLPPLVSISRSAIIVA
jgi:hypothetical protein